MSQLLRVAISISLLIGALLVPLRSAPGEAVPIRNPLDSFPGALEEWQGRGGVIFTPEVMKTLDPTDYLMRRYQDPAGRSLWLFIAYWGSRSGWAPHSPKYCLPGAGWEFLEVSDVTIPLAAPFAPITVNRYLVQKDRRQQLVFYWYQSQGKAIAGELSARAEMVKNSIGRHRTDGALVSITSPVYGSVRQTSDRLVKYIQAMYPVLGEFLPD